MCQKYVLQQKQLLRLEDKIRLTKRRIKDFYDHMNGNVYVAFSGGKDSTVLLNIVRTVFPNVRAVFCDTGLEFPEIREFVKETENVTWIKPKMSFYQVIKKYGYPCISKEQSHFIRQYRTTKSEYLKNVRWNGKNGKYKISEKWKFLVDAPFKISDQCCDILKKNPFKKFERETNLRGYIGTLACDSNMRERNYLRYGCTILTEGKEKCMPLSFWLEKDIWDYINQKKIPYSPIYDNDVDRTGCIFCLYGIHLEKNDRFEILKELHPNLYHYCMKKLEIEKVLNFIKKEHP